MQGALKSGRGNRTHPEHCVTCGVPLLIRKLHKSPPVGYRWHQGKGKCGTCYERERPRKDKPVPLIPPAPTNPEELARREAANRRDFVRYILARRKRLRRADLSLRGIEGLEELG